MYVVHIITRRRLALVLDGPTEPTGARTCRSGRAADSEIATARTGETRPLGHDDRANGQASGSKVQRDGCRGGRGM